MDRAGESAAIPTNGLWLVITHLGHGEVGQLGHHSGLPRTAPCARPRGGERVHAAPADGYRPASSTPPLGAARSPADVQS